MSYPEIVLPRLKNELDINNASFIAVVRDPVKRACSHYQHLVRARGLTETFKTVAEIDINSRSKRCPATWTNVITDGLYGVHLEKWFDAVGNNLKVVLYESLCEDHLNSIHSIFKFLDLPPQAETDLLLSLIHI